MNSNQNDIATTIQNLIKDQKSFVFYKKPMADSLILVVQHDNHLRTTQSFDDSGFVFAPFAGVERTVFFSIANSEVSFFKVPVKKNSVNTERQITHQNKSDYIALLRKTIRFIQDQKANKIVFSRCINHNYSEDLIGEIYEDLVQTYHEAFVSIWSHPKVGLWMGATPEQLLKLDKSSFNTMSLAGTQVFSEKVKWKEKEIAEQKWVTDYITKQLKPLTSKLIKSKSFTKKAGHLAHICTEIKGEMEKDKTLKDLIDALHPTPAVCGTPREVATDYILKNETYNREFYTGFLGEINTNNQSELFVNLRCMQLKGGVANIYVGGGITKDSIPEKEWEETVAKSAVLGRFLK